MLYIEGDTSETWPEVARSLGELEQVQMVAQLYVEGPPPSPFLPATSTLDFEPTTTFGSGKSTMPSAPLPVDAELLASLASMQTKTKETECDFALYRIGERKWVACAIPHENMVLIQDHGLLARLRQAGLLVSEKKPDWW